MAWRNSGTGSRIPSHTPATVAKRPVLGRSSNFCVCLEGEARTVIVELVVERSQNGGPWNPSSTTQALAVPSSFMVSRA